MNSTSIAAVVDELEKIALSPEGAARIRQNVQEARKRGYSDIKDRLTGETVRHTAQDVPFHKGVIRNARATFRRVVHPRSGLRSFTKSFTNPATPKWMRGLQAAGAVATVANAAPKNDPSGQGESRIRRLTKGVGALAGSTVGRGWTGGLLGGAIGEKAGDLLGKGVDKLRRYKAPEAD